MDSLTIFKLLVTSPIIPSAGLGYMLATFTLWAIRSIQVSHNHLQWKEILLKCFERILK